MHVGKGSVYQPNPIHVRRIASMAEAIDDTHPPVETNDSSVRAKTRPAPEGADRNRVRH